LLARAYREEACLTSARGIIIAYLWLLEPSQVWLRAIYDYAEGFPPIVGTALNGYILTFVEALIDDEEVRLEAIEFYYEVETRRSA